MTKELCDMIDMLEYEELVRLKDDLDAGGEVINRLIEVRIREELSKYEGICSVCNSNIHPDNENNFIMVFGSDELKKKAQFCGIDCMEYFIAHLKMIKKKEAIE